ncbi:MAG: sporulation protein YqfC [Clostridiales bacterium]|nr:sporulation protein YqfC [Clostridiales bacterium]
MHDAELFPAELLKDVPKITMTGNQAVYVEQHKGLMGYLDNEIILRTSIGKLRLGGSNMWFKRYTSSEALICGEIQSLYIQGGQTGEGKHSKNNG